MTDRLYCVGEEKNKGGEGKGKSLLKQMACL